MRSIAIIGKYTFISLLKSKVFYNIIGLIGIQIFFSYIAAEFTYGVASRVALDIGLALISLSLLFIGLFLGINLVNREVDDRTIYMLLSHPVSRSEFIIGKIWGMILLLTLNLLMSLLFTYGYYALLGGTFNELFLWISFFILFEAILMFLIVVLFSLISNKVITIMSSIMIFIVGHVAEEQLQIVAESGSIYNKLIYYVSYVVPNFFKFNIKEFILYKENLNGQYLISNFSYCIIYIILLTGLSTIIFNRKNID